MAFQAIRELILGDLGGEWSVRDFMDKLTGGGAARASNNWVVHGALDSACCVSAGHGHVRPGRHTASGKPLLANDPHLELTLPSVWIMTAIEVTVGDSQCTYSVTRVRRRAAGPGACDGWRIAPRRPWHCYRSQQAHCVGRHQRRHGRAGAPSMADVSSVALWFPYPAQDLYVARQVDETQYLWDDGGGGGAVATPYDVLETTIRIKGAKNWKVSGVVTQDGVV